MQMYMEGTCFSLLDIFYCILKGHQDKVKIIEIHLHFSNISGRCVDGLTEARDVWAGS